MFKVPASKMIIQNIHNDYPKYPQYRLDPQYRLQRLLSTFFLNSRAALTTFPLVMMPTFQTESCLKSQGNSTKRRKKKQKENNKVCRTHQFAGTVNNRQHAVFSCKE
jgi:hypothetical protein